MANHFSIPAWEISWTEEHGMLQFMMFQGNEHDWVTKQQYNIHITLNYIQCFVITYKRKVS